MMALREKLKLFSLDFFKAAALALVSPLTGILSRATASIKIDFPKKSGGATPIFGRGGRGGTTV